MKILYYSDIHIEIRAGETQRESWTDNHLLALGPDLRQYAGRVDLAVLAGDIGTIRERRGISAIGYAGEAAKLLRCPVVVVPGNHEYYRGSFEEDRAALLEARVPGVVALDRGTAVIDGLRVLGATLWTDYALLGDPVKAMAVAGISMNDHRLIRCRNGTELFRPEHARDEHRLARTWLLEELGRPFAGPSLVVTHHGPHSAALHPGYGINPLLPAFCSDCDELLDAAQAIGAVGWIFGHHHWSHAVEHRGVRLLSAQIGYPGEDTGWRGPGLIEI